MTTLVENGIEPVFLPAHMTHLIQPLDDVPFAAFKRKLAAAKAKHTSDCLALRETPKGGLQQVIVDAFAESFSLEIIKHAFKATGLVPFDEKVIRSRATQVTDQNDSKPSSAAPRSLEDEVVLLAKTQLGLQQPLKQKKTAIIKEENTLYLGSDLIVAKEAKVAEAALASKAKEDAALERQNKKRKREDERVQRQEAVKRVMVERESKKKVEAELKLKKYCRKCTSHRPERLNWWTCPKCGEYKLCALHSADVALVQEHIGKCN